MKQSGHLVAFGVIDLFLDWRQFSASGELGVRMFSEELSLHISSLHMIHLRLASYWGLYRPFG